MLALPRQHQRGGPDASLPKMAVLLSSQNKQMRRETGRNYTNGETDKQKVHVLYEHVH